VALAAAALPEPDPQRPALVEISRRIAALQTAIHPEPAAALRRGSLSLLGRPVNVQGIESIDWTLPSDRALSALRRLTLAYCGWAVPLLAERQPTDLANTATAIDRLDGVPWSTPGIFRDLWNPYTASHRLINLLTALHLHKAPTDRGTDGWRILEHARRCAAFIASDPERDIQANHLLKNWTALAVYAASTPSPPSVFPSLDRKVARSLEQLILEDGGHAERSPMYHALGLLDIEVLLASGAVPELQSRLIDVADRMRHALSLLTHPDGDIALFNDAWLGGAPSSRDLGAEPAATTARAVALPQTGYVRLESHEEAAIFDCGPCGLDLQPGHAHADFLSLEFSVGGHRFLVDPGTPTYTAGERRDRLRSAASHNGPHVDGAEPIEFWKSFRIGRRANAGGLHDAGLAEAPLWCAGWQDGYATLGVDVRRWIGLWPGQALLVVDAWTGAAAGRAHSSFLIPEPWRGSAANSALIFNGPSSVRVEAAAGHLELGSGVWCARYGIEQPATTIRVHPKENGGETTAAVLFSWGNGPRPEPVDIAALARCLRQARQVAPAGYQR